MVGLSRDEAALDRLVIATPHLARLVNQYLSGFPEASKQKIISSQESCPIAIA